MSRSDKANDKSESQHMQFLATRPLQSVGAQSFSTWVLQTAWDGEGASV